MDQRGRDPTSGAFAFHFCRHTGSKYRSSPRPARGGMALSALEWRAGISHRADRRIPRGKGWTNYAGWSSRFASATD